MEDINLLEEFEGLESLQIGDPDKLGAGSGSGAEDTAPLEPWQALCFFLEKFRIIKSGENKSREEEALDFLKEASNVKLPYVTTVGGELTPYRIYPIAAYRIINAAVKVLEKDLEKEIQGQPSGRFDQNTLVGIATLADTLFSGACTHPEGNFLIHKLDPNTSEITLKGHGRRIKQLATRLTRWRTVYSDILSERGLQSNLPTLSCREVVAQEVSSSLQRFKITQGVNFEGVNPLGSSDSIEALKENMGLEPSMSIDQDSYSDAYLSDSDLGSYEEQRESWESEIAQANWIGLDIPQNIRSRNLIRGNVISENPKDWIWTYDEAPLDFVVNYVCAHAKPCLEEAHSLLIEASENPSISQLGTYALTIDPKSKVNPDSYWKIIKRIAHHFPSLKPESDNISRKLDTARFILSLNAINKRLNIDESLYIKNYHKQVYEAIDKSKSSDQPITRNNILVKALEETCPQMSAIEKEQWLEHLQSFAVGAYENSKGMELERKKLLGRINHLFKAPREELEKTKHNSEDNKETIKKLHNVIESASNAFYKYLSGPTGQMTRRELRTKVQSMKTWAEERGNENLVKELSEISKFISSISSQIKSGQWYLNEKENKKILLGFLYKMLQTPKPSRGPEFPGSREPEPKDPLEITIDFLRSYGDEKQLAPGKNTIAEIIKLCKDRQKADDGVEIAQALREITKNKTETLPVIQEREKALAGAIEVSQKLHESNQPIKDVAEMFEKELQILDIEDSKPTDIDPFEDTSSPRIDSSGQLQSKPSSAIEWVGNKINEFVEEQNDPNFYQSPEWLSKVKQTELVTRRLLEASARFKDKDLQKYDSTILEQNRKLQRIVNQRLQKNLAFWKGINYIGQNIQSRREAEKYQVSPTGRGTLQNIIAIVKAKIQGREVSLNTNDKHKRLMDNKTLRQFKISKTRGRTLITNAGVPIALWLAKDVKGTKTKINKNEFIETLKARHKACVVCLDLNKKDTTIEEKLHQYNEREKEDRNAINTHILDQCITMLEDKENLVGGLDWINSNRAIASNILKSNPTLDTPNLIYQHDKGSHKKKDQIQEKPSKTTKKLPEDLDYTIN